MNERQERRDPAHTLHDDRELRRDACRRTGRLVARSLVVLVNLALAFVGWRYVSGNFGTLAPGQMYRSNQLSPAGLSKVLHEKHIRTVLNLRGTNPNQAWYRAERAATLAAGATQIDVPMASDQWLTRDEARTLVRLLDVSTPPLLIHCEWGAERTGLVSSFAELLRPGGSLASARAQFSLYYLYLPTRNGRTMRGHLDRYEAWLHSQDLAHSPAQFRRWVLEVYRPGSPSREEWPYIPLPLAVITRPGAQEPEIVGPVSTAPRSSPVPPESVSRPVR